ncbi:MAG: hypothetical protein WAV31_06220 [Candidatus Moraniibacteriota bacterium]
MEKFTKCGAERIREFSVPSNKIGYSGESAWPDSHSMIHRCELEEGHLGEHRESLGYEDIFIVWKKDDRKECSECRKKLGTCHTIATCRKCGEMKCNDCMIPNHSKEIFGFYNAWNEQKHICHKCIKAREKKL